MSHAVLIEEGSGKIGVRVSIAGLGVEFVSDPQMAGTTADGRRRVYCLPPMGEGIVLEERINIPEATADASGNRIPLLETEDEDLSQLFNALPETETFLLSTVNQNGTQLIVQSETGFAAGDVVHVGTEAILLANVSGGILHVQSRGHWDTQAQAHYSQDANVGGGTRIVSSSPVRIRGRRVRVFMYGEGDDLQGDGTQVWLGKVTSDATCEGGTRWSFSVDNILAVLRAKVGSEIEGAIKPRGAYYHWAAPCHLQVIENAAPTQVINLFGFFEDNEAFVVRLQQELDIKTAGLDSAYSATIAEDGRWTISVSVGPSTTDILILINSPVDGVLVPLTRWLDSDGNSGAAVTSGETISIDWQNSGNTNDPQGRATPRGFFGIPPINFDHVNSFYADESLRESLPDSRIYVGTPVSNDWTAVQIKWPQAGSTTGYAEDTVNLEGTSVAENWIKPRARALLPGIYFGATSLPSIKTGRTIAVGSLADFIAGLTQDAPQHANRLTLPAIWADDFADILDIRDVLDRAANGRGFLTNRIFTIFSPTDVDKLISQHCRALNCYPCLDDDGRITFRQFEVPNASTSAFYQIDDEVWLDQQATLAPEEQGVYNVVAFRTGYSAIENKHTGDPFIVHDFRAFGDEQELHELEIAMQSNPVMGDVSIEAMDVATIAHATLGYFAAPYKVVQGIAVSWSAFPIQCGSVIAIDSQYLPDFDGFRPMSEVVGILVSRRWALGEAYGTFDIVVSSQNVAGYAPTAFVDVGAFVNVAGNTWDITITTGRYAPEGTTEDDFFITGDLVRLITYDSETPTEYTGTVQSVNTSTHVIRVAFTGALTSPELGEWWLIYQSYSALTEAQKVFCVIAQSNGRIGGTERARTFAP